MAGKRVLSVGQCLADHGAIARTLQHHFGAEVEAADTQVEAWEKLREKTFDLVLVNRILDRNGSSGMEVISQLKKDKALRALPVMLVSNFPEAQEEAQSLGTLPGFGKASLGQPLMLGRIGAVLGSGP
jgi:CheY-like chemotaxis protein